MLLTFWVLINRCSRTNTKLVHESLWLMGLESLWEYKSSEMAVLFFYSHFVFFIFALYSLIVIIAYLQNVVLKETVSPSSISNIHSGCSNFKPNTKTKCLIYHFLSIFDLKMSLFVCYLSVFCFSMDTWSSLLFPIFTFIKL